MKNTLKLSLKPNEKLYVNGAVIRVDRKVTLELLNDVQFLMENHVLQPEEASTPLRQLYFILQVMLMNPQAATEARAMFRRSLPLMLANFTNEQIAGTSRTSTAWSARTRSTRRCGRSARSIRWSRPSLPARTKTHSMRKTGTPCVRWR